MALFEFLDPKNEVAFKRIFRTDKNKDIVIHFLNGILSLSGEKQITNVNFLNQDQEVACLRLNNSIVDVLCTDSCGIKNIVLMYVWKTHGFVKFAQDYASETYLNQAFKGGLYENVKGIIFIAIVDFVPDRVTYEKDLKDFSFTFIELPKFNKSKDELLNIKEKWIYFLKCAYKVTSKQDLLDVVGGDSTILKAYMELSKYDWTLAEFSQYQHTAERLAVCYNNLNRSYKEGRIDIVRRILRAGYDIHFISETCGSSVDELQQLRKCTCNDFSCGYCNL